MREPLELRLGWRIATLSLAALLLGCSAPVALAPKLPGLIAADLCLRWLLRARLAWSEPADDSWPDPGPLPSTCGYLDDIDSALAVRRAMASDTIPVLRAEEAIGTIAHETLREVIRSWVHLPPQPGPNIDDIVSAAVALLARKTLTDNDLDFALRLIPRLTPRPRTRRALIVRIMVDYPQRPPVFAWRASNPADAESALNAMSIRQLRIHFENLAGAYNTQEIGRSLEQRHWQEKSALHRFWAGRLAFLERRYEDALRAFNFRTHGAPERERQVWYARTLARLERMTDSQRAFMAIAGTWDQWRCEAAFRLSLIAGYQSDTVKQQNILQDALPRCHNKGGVAEEMTWEIWRVYMFSGDKAAARKTLVRNRLALEDGGYLTTSESLFWLCFLAFSAADTCTSTPEVEPFLAYRLAIPGLTAPALRLTDPLTDGNRTIPAARLLLDLRLAGWDDLYALLLTDLYRTRSSPELEEVVTSWSRQRSEYEAVRIIRTGLPADRSVDWRHFTGLFPQAFAGKVQQIASEEGIDPALIWGIMREESRFRPDARSWVGAIGLMQLMPDTARAMDRDNLLSTHSLTEPEINIRLGARLLANLVKYYDGNLIWTIAAYNAGRNAVDLWRTRYSGMPLFVAVELIPYPQTRRYVKKVSQSYQIYRFRSGGGNVVPADPGRSAVELCCSRTSIGTGAAGQLAEQPHSAFPLLFPDG